MSVFVVCVYICASQNEVARAGKFVSGVFFNGVCFKVSLLVVQYLGHKRTASSFLACTSA